MSNGEERTGPIHGSNGTEDRVAVARMTASTYDLYYKTGFYASRYPQANQRVLRLLRRVLDAAGPGAVIDLGCGNGRYFVPVLQGNDREAFGFDICARCLIDLRGRLDRSGLGARGHLVEGDATDVAEAVRDRPVVLAMIMFGVLSHIAGHGNRIDTLRRLAEAVEPERGRVVLSVPNRLRRFRRHPADVEGDIVYRRTTGEGDLTLYYHLYDPETIRRDLAEAGLAVEQMVAESLLPESWITRHRWLGVLDGVFSRFVPARFGYGLLIVAKRCRPT